MAPEGHRTGANRRLDKLELATCQHSRANMHMSVDLDAREAAAAPCRSRRGFPFRSNIGLGLVRDNAVNAKSP
jgi:hypothetical protein